MATNSECYPVSELAESLGKFYLDARTVKGDHYKTSTLENLRHSLNRHLKAPPHNKRYDIITSGEFLDANENFKTALKELKQAGYGSTDHYPNISDEDLTKLYMSVYLTPNTPTGLLNRVQMNVRLFFCRRANEKFEKMTKSTFKVGTYPDGTRYVYKAEDELTKNHKANQKSLISGHMPEDSTNEDVCPVRLFEMYLMKLNPASQRLWQYPLESFVQNGDTWYQNRPMGRDKLSLFMKELSKKVPLSKVYTNHSIRVTGVSILGRGFSTPQNMAVSGHRSTTSLAVYHRVSDTEKKAMGKAINNTINNRDQLAIQAPPALPAISPAESDLQVENFDWLFSNFDSLPDVPFSSQVTNQMGRGMFNNCQISGLTINININKN